METKIKIIKAAIIFVLMMLTVGPMGVVAEVDEKPTASADVGVYSKYVWRGFELSDDSMVIQPSTTIGYKGFSLNLWGNLDTEYDDGRDTSQFNETDLTLSYDTSIGPVDCGFGYIYYGLDAVDDSQEFYASAGLDVPMAPTLSIYREVSHYPAWYLTFGVSHSFDLSSEMTLDLAGSMGYYSYSDDDFVEVDDNLNPTTEKYKNFHDGLVSMGLTVPFNKYFTFSPMIAYSFPLTDEADNFITSGSFSNDSDFFYGGATVSISL